MSRTDLSADDVIRLLDLQPHPEGGHYVETFRDGGGVTGPRGASSAIYYLLREGEMSAWHRVTDASEVWHWHGGDAMELRVAPFGGGPATTIRLGPDLAAGERPQGGRAAGRLADCATDRHVVACRMHGGPGIPVRCVGTGARGLETRRRLEPA